MVCVVTRETVDATNVFRCFSVGGDGSVRFNVTLKPPPGSLVFYSGSSTLLLMLLLLRMRENPKHEPADLDFFATHERTQVKRLDGLVRTLALYGILERNSMDSTT